jgi:succinate dehydrogenase / fumarate reductase membrane anchor subunit
MPFVVLLFTVSALIHAWIGMRDILMDYVKPTGLRLAFQIATIVWLVGCAGWAVRILWRL